MTKVQLFLFLSYIFSFYISKLMPECSFRNNRSKNYGYRISIGWNYYYRYSNASLSLESLPASRRRCSAVGAYFSKIVEFIFPNVRSTWLFHVEISTARFGFAAEWKRRSWEIGKRKTIRGLFLSNVPHSSDKRILIKGSVVGKIFHLKDVSTFARKLPEKLC